MTHDDWHARYQQQARWTRPLRDYLLNRIGITPSHTILDVGCGTGVLLDEMQVYMPTAICGIDIDPLASRISKRNAPSASIICSDAYHLPFVSRAFDITFCHFLLLWVSSPLNIVSEMERVTRSGGFVIAFAEPDYGGRIDYPESLEIIGTMQTDSLHRQGADPMIGRKLAGLFHQTSLACIECGILGAQWSKTATTNEFELEWTILKSDITNSMLNDIDLEQYKTTDMLARQMGTRVLYVPTFYAFGMVPH